MIFRTNFIASFHSKKIFFDNIIDAGGRGVRLGYGENWTQVSIGVATVTEDLITLVLDVTPTS